MGSILNSFQQGFSLLMRTLPYVLVRVLIYGLYGLVAVLYFGAALLLSKLFGGAGGIVMLVALGLFGAFYYWSRRYLLYMVKAGHVALLTEMHSGRNPEGQGGQFQYGKELVKNRVKDISILFAVDALVEGVLRAFSRTVVSIADILPLPGLQGLAKAGTAIVDRSLTYVDEAIFSYSILHRDKDLWVAAKEGVILYAQTWKQLLQTAVAVWLAAKIFIVLAALLLLIPFGMLAAAFPAMNWAFLLSAIALAVLAEAALFEPLALATMIVAFQEGVRGQVPHPEWEARLETVSGKFRELKEKAAAAVAARGKEAPSLPAQPGATV